MKKDIHPQTHPKATIRCGCGHTFIIASAMPQMEVEICSQCHPFYTGTKKIVDAAGQVEKFKARMQKTQALKTKKTVRHAIPPKNKKGKEKKR